MMSILGWYYGRDIWIPPMKLLGVIAQQEFLPLLGGMLLAYFLSHRAQGIQRVMSLAGNVLLVVALVLVLYKLRSELGKVTLWLALAAPLLAAGCLFSVRLFLPDGRSETVQTLSTCNANRHVGLALLLSNQHIHDQRPIPAIAAYALAALLVMGLYAKFIWRSPMPHKRVKSAARREQLMHFMRCEKTVRSAAITVAMLFIGLSLLGILGVWWVERTAAGIVLKGFGLVETAVDVTDAGVARVDELIATSRTEVRQASETITAVGARAQANSPVLNALNERLETNLTPRLAQMRQSLAPVRDAVGTVGDVVSLLNSVPGMADRAPRLAALDETLNRLEGLSADTTQLRSTLRALVVEQKSDVTAETVATLNSLTQRIDTRLGEVQSSVQGVQESIAMLQVRLAARKARVLFVCHLLAWLGTLVLVWIFYSPNRCHPALPNKVALAPTRATAERVSLLKS